MRKKSLVALLLVLALACVPLVGCGESGKGYSTTKKLDLNDYAIAASDVYGGVKMSNSKKAFTTATVETGNLATLGDNLGEKRYGKKYTENGSVLYDFVAHTVRYADKAYDSINDYNNGLIACYSDNENGSKSYDVYERVNLNLLTSFTSYSEITYSTVYGYVNGERVSAYRYEYKASADADNNSYKYYVRTEAAADTRQTYKEIAEEDFKSTNVTVGSVVNAKDPSPVYYTNAVVPYADMESYTYTYTSVDSDIDGMSNYTYTFFKNGAKSGELTITDGMTVGFVDKYFYYNEFEPVAYDAVKGYNFILQTNTADNATASKYNVTTYRYDIKKNKTSKVELGYIPFQAGNIYNHADKKYDAMLVAAYGKTDGVAITNSSIMLLIVDKDMKVGYDFTGKPFGFNTDNVAKLKENRFIDVEDGNTYIYNKKLEIVASFNSATYEINDNLGLVIFNKGGKTMAVDYDGKVVFKNQYTNPYYYGSRSGLDFYGNYAVASVTKDNGDTETPMIVSKDNLEGTKIVKLDNERLLNGSDYSGIIVKADDQRNYTFTNYDGKVLHTVKVEGSAFGNLESYFDSETGDQYACFHYSDAAGTQYTIVFTC